MDKIKRLPFEGIRKPLRQCKFTRPRFKRRGLQREIQHLIFFSFNQQLLILKVKNVDSKLFDNIGLGNTQETPQAFVWQYSSRNSEQETDHPL
jgi:hypothetical protein